MTIESELLGEGTDSFYQQKFSDLNLSQETIKW